jgi:hypothetical protein
MRVAESSVAKGSAIEHLLIEQYRALLTRVFVLQVSSRVLCLASAGFVAFLREPSVLQVTAAVVAVAIIVSVWSIEQESLRVQIQGLEETLAGRTGGEWEQTYIQSRYFASITHRAAQRLQVEPALWLAFAVVLAIGRLLDERILG